MGISGKIIWGLALAAHLGISAKGAEGRSREGPIQTILVHDMAAVPAEVLARAKEEVTRIFSRANVRIAWLYCSATAGEADVLRPCPPRPAGTIILRIVPATLDFLDAPALGYALTPGRAGVYATVSFRRVQLCVARQTTSAASLEQVLGHATAHELGHILLGTNSHSAAGLMRPDWDARALDDASKGRLNFLPDEARRIQDAVAQRVRGETNRPQAIAGDSMRR